MQRIGKVRNYNGITGTVVSENKVYVFSNHGIFGEVKNDDWVTFDILSNDIVTNVRKFVNESIHTYIKKNFKKNEE